MSFLYFSKLFKWILIPLIIFSIIYIVILAIYSVKNKNQENYIYNINFYLYILGILFVTVFFSISLTSLIFRVKQNSYLFNNDIVSLTIILIISFIILSILLYKLFVLIKSHDNKLSLSKLSKKSAKELQYMLNEIDFTNVRPNIKTENITIEEIEII